jgi:hypothetical protein
MQRAKLGPDPYFELGPRLNLLADALQRPSPPTGRSSQAMNEALPFSAGLPAPPGRADPIFRGAQRLATCAQLFFFLNGFWGTRGAIKCDAVSALNLLGGERTSRSAPNPGGPTAICWNTA